MIDVHSNGLTVECVFAAGPPETSCTVILVMYGVELRRETSSGVMTFHDLDSGNYTVLVYDSDSVMEGSSVPAIERDVKVTNADIVPDLTFSVTKDTVTVSPSEASTSTGYSTTFRRLFYFFPTQIHQHPHLQLLQSSLVRLCFVCILC